MKKQNKFSPEVRERAVRMVLEHRGEYPSLWATIESIAPKIGCVPQTLNDWVRKHEVDTGTRDGVMPVTNAYTESINRLAKDKNREGRGYTFEVMRARMLYTTKHKKKTLTAKVSPFYKKTIGYGLPDFEEELNYGVDLSTI